MSSACSGFQLIPPTTSHSNSKWLELENRISLWAANSQLFAWNAGRGVHCRVCMGTASLTDRSVPYFQEITSVILFPRLKSTEEIGWRVLFTLIILSLYFFFFDASKCLLMLYWGNLKGHFFLYLYRDDIIWYSILLPWY